MPELSWNINLLKREENNYFTKKKKKISPFDGTGSFISVFMAARY